MTIESDDEEEEEVRKPTRKEPVRWDKVETEKGVRFKEPVVEKLLCRLVLWNRTETYQGPWSQDLFECDEFLVL